MCVNLDHLRAGFPSSRVSEAHVTLTDDREFHITLVSQDGTRNNYFYDTRGEFIYQRGGHANYLYDYYRQAYTAVETAAVREWQAYSQYIR